MKALSKEAQAAISSAHVKALDALEYPSYRAGDVVLWMRETLHAGPEGNDTGTHAGRLYLGGLPDNELNRDAVKRQWAKLLDGKQAHGRACDRTEIAQNMNALFTRDMQLRAGAGFVPPPPPPSPRDNELFEVTQDTLGLGFKNATAVLNLKVAIDELPSLAVGTPVFVKIGEHSSDAHFAVECAKLRASIGIFSLPSAVIWVQPTIDWVALANRTNAKWGGGVRKVLHLCQIHPFTL